MLSPMASRGSSVKAGAGRGLGTALTSTAACSPVAVAATTVNVTVVSSSLSELTVQRPWPRSVSRA